MQDFTHLISTLSYLFYIRSYIRRKNSDFILYCICTTVLLYTHYYGLVVFASQGIIFIFISIFLKLPRAIVIKSIGSAFVCMALFIPWIPQILKHSALESFWIVQVSPDFLFRYFYDYFNKDFVTSVIFALLILICVKSSIYSLRSSTTHDKIILIIILGWIILGYAIPLCYSLLKMPILIIRHTMIVLPAVLIVIASAIANLKIHRLRMSLLAIVSLATFCNLFFINPYFSVTRKQQLREITDQVSQVSCENCIYVSDMTWYFDYYLRQYGINRPSLNAFELTE